MHETSYMRTLQKTLLFIGFTLFASIPAKAGTPLTINSKYTNSKSINTLDGWRIGFGLGYSLYIGDQMDNTITKNFGDFKELRTNITIGAFKAVNQEKERGLVFKHGSFQTLNSSNSKGIQCDYNELQIMFQYSLNENVGLNSGPFTCNLQYGFGVTSFKSMYFTVNPNFQTIDVIKSSVGYNLQSGKDLNGNDLEHIAGKKIAFLGNIGLNLGFRTGRNLTLYFENSLQASMSNKLSGNLFKISIIPPDCYFYTGFALYYRFGGSISKLGCPRF